MPKKNNAIDKLLMKLKKSSKKGGVLVEGDIKMNKKIRNILQQASIGQDTASKFKSSELGKGGVLVGGKKKRKRKNTKRKKKGGSNASSSTFEALPRAPRGKRQGGLLSSDLLEVQRSVRGGKINKKKFAISAQKTERAFEKLLGGRLRQIKSDEFKELEKCIHSGKLSLKDILKNIPMKRVKKSKGGVMVAGKLKKRKESDWIKLVKHVQKKMKVSYCEALQIASKLRKQN